MRSAPQLSTRNARRAFERDSRGPWSRKTRAIAAQTSAASSGRMNASSVVANVGPLLDRQPAKLHLLPGGDVGDVTASRARDLGEQAELAGREDAVGHANAHHEVAGRRPSEEDADPLQPLLVVVADRLPALASETGEIHVEAVTNGFERLDLVHARASEILRSRTAHAFSSGCCDSGSRALSVRLLADL